MAEKCELCDNSVFCKKELYQCDGRNSKVSLCIEHERELFLIGEKRLFMAYPELENKRTLKKYSLKPNKLLMGD